MTKIGRDAVLYVESLIESIMGGLEGLINILDSEGGFGALEIQVDTSVMLQHKGIFERDPVFLFHEIDFEKSCSFFQSRQPLISTMHLKFQFLQLNLQS